MPIVTAALFFAASLSATTAPGDVIRLDGDEGRHAARVKRVQVGETLLVGDGVGVLATAVVRSVQADALTLVVTELRHEPVPEPRLVAIQALPKGDRAELAVEVMTELGVDEIVPWAASRSIVQWQGPRGERARARWQATAREAAKQSRRAYVPVVAPLASTGQVAQRISSASMALVLHEEATVGLGEIVLPDSGEIVLVIGPEGGISSDEVATFTTCGAVALRLGPQVLRTSTAGAAAIAAISPQLRRW